MGRTILEVLVTFIIVLEIQALLSVIVHMLNGTKKIPQQWGEYFKFLFIFHVLFHLKKYRTT